MISFTCQCARASAGTRIQTAPATAATRAMTSSTTYRGPPQWMPMPAAAQAPMKNCPSEPMFQIFMRSAMCTASAFIRIGVRSTPNSSSPCTSPNVPSTAFHSRLSGLRPVSARTTAATTSAASTPPTRASAAWLGVTFSRRSTRNRRRFDRRDRRLGDAHDAGLRTRSGLGGMAAHQQPEPLPIGVAPIEHADDAAFVHHRDAVADQQHLVEVVGDQQHRATAVASGQEGRLHVLCGVDVEATRRVHRDERRLGDEGLAVDDQPLLVPAGEDARHRERATAFGHAPCRPVVERTRRSPGASTRAIRTARRRGSGGARRCHERRPTGRVRCRCGPRGCCRLRRRRSAAATRS